jgi:hypothetical protein
VGGGNRKEVRSMVREGKELIAELGASDMTKQHASHLLSCTDFPAATGYLNSS